MTAVYYLNKDDLSIELINSIRASFADKPLEITVTEALDETEYLLASKANREHLKTSMKEADEGKIVTFTLEEFQNKYGTK